MNNFPLYQTLNKNLSKKDLTVPQKNILIKKVSNLDLDGQELVYALIKCYYVDHQKEDNLGIPYGGILNRDKIDFNLLDLPIELRHILFKFVEIHEKKDKDD